LRPYLLALPAFLFTLALVALPLLAMARMSFYNRTSLTVYDPETFTLKNYASFAGSGYLMETTLQTIAYALIVTIASLILAYPVAYYLARTRSRWRPVLFAIVIMPFMLSLVVSAYGWLLLLGLNGPLNYFLTKLPFIREPLQLANRPIGGLIAMTVNFIPYHVLPLLSALRSIDTHLEEASSSLGASPVQTFFRVVLPLSAPGVLSGCVLVMILGLTAFVAPRMVGGQQMSMLGVEIYQNMIVYLNWPQAAAIGFVLTAITILAFLLLARGLRSEHLEQERGTA
jgi:putative spermidine/putrescine transport system permease protein